MDYEGLCKDLTDQSKVIGSSGKGWGKFAGTNRKAAAAITDLLARAEAAEARCETLEKMVREYQDVIVPGYRERAEKAEMERDDAISDLETIMFVGDSGLDTCDFCKNNQCYARSGNNPCLPRWRGIKEE